MTGVGRPPSNRLVAELAEVSPATVSRVMNGRFSGDPAIAVRVQEIAAAVGYAPNHLARALALGETKAIALVVPDLTNPAFQQILSGLSRAASKDGHRVLVADSAEDATLEPLLARDTRSRCDALVLCAPRMPEEKLRAMAHSLKPLVLINRSLDGAGVPSLSIDYGNGIRKLATHLYHLGHRRFVYLAGSADSVSNQRRHRGLDQFVASFPDVGVTRISCGVSSSAGRSMAEHVVDTDATAVLAFNDLVAIGLMQRLGELGVRTPDDVSVTGFDDIELAGYSVPPLTSAAVPYVSLGEESWRRLSALLEGATPDFDISFQPSVVERASTGPMKPRKAQRRGAER